MDPHFSRRPSSGGAGELTNGSGQAQEGVTEQPGNNVALFSCLTSLMQDKTSANIIKELISSSSKIKVLVPEQEQERPNEGSSLQVAQANGTNSSSTPVVLGQFGVSAHASNWPNEVALGQHQLDWAELGRKLPAVESPYQLEALSERWQFCLVIIYSLTAITSFILNVITVIVLTRSRRSELRKYLINLSMSDLLMSLFSIRK